MSFCSKCFLSCSGVSNQAGYVLAFVAVKLREPAGKAYEHHAVIA